MIRRAVSFFIIFKLFIICFICDLIDISVQFVSMTMEWDSGLSPTHRAPASKGRRAGLSLLSSRDDRPSLSADYLQDTSLGQFNEGPPPTAPPRARRTGGWADEGLKSGKKRSASNLIERERFGSPDGNKAYDSDDDIPLIPELEDAVDEDSASRSHHAPSIAMNRVATYKELDSDLLKNASFTKLDDINLSLLATSLHNESEVKEEMDVIWSWDSLFTDVSSDFHREWESKQAQTERPLS